ncbi:MAG: heme biosynthesis HemY N-terminal domain-containing protein [Methyloceanibacter sp.]|nr:heme biosynthesis HemY N-terminal domain-containing protein [Methyloceanibacter sp.]
MTRILFFIVLVIAAALGLAWLADRPGTISVEWLGYQIETSAFVGVVTVALFVVALIVIFAIIRYVWTRPAAIAAHMKERKQKQGFDALSRGLVAIGVGDRAQAQRYAGIAQRNLPREPLTALLKAQTAQLKGDDAGARRSFEGMLDNHDTELLGVRGLFLEAKRAGDEGAARLLAQKAVDRNPKLAWGVNALFDLQARAGDWDNALNTLAIARQNGHLDSKAANRRRAVLLTAEARETESFDPSKALILANEALRLAPSLVPASEIAGRLLTSKGEVRAASRQILRTWSLSPHPDLAVAYAFAKPGLSPKDRLKRVEYLAKQTPGDVEGAVAIAQAAVEAQDWDRARDALKPYLEDAPSARICTLMARIEGGSGDKGREREWLARALRAPRDRAWIADGYVSDRWLPVSPVTGVIDAFEWKAPADAIGRPDETLQIDEWTGPPRDASAMMRESLAVPPPVTESEPAPRETEEAAPALDDTVIEGTAEEVSASEPEPAEHPSADDSVESQTPEPVPSPKTSDGTDGATKGDKLETADKATLGDQPGNGGADAKADGPQKTEGAAPALPPRAPDDPGVAPESEDESEVSLERFRSAHIR